jgi:hypothetical protein
MPPAIAALDEQLAYAVDQEPVPAEIGAAAYLTRSVAG